MRNVSNSRSVGPSPARARSAARVTAAITAVTSLPSTVSPAIPYPTARSDNFAQAYCSLTGVDSPYWLFSTTKRTGSFQTAARFKASWKSPSLVAPSPVKLAATRRSPRS